jgi:hypothetical protein
MFAAGCPRPENATAAAYADDLAIFSGSLAGMCASLEKVQLYCEWARIKVNPKKCAFTGREHRTRSATAPSLQAEAAAQIRLDGVSLPFLSHTEPYKYLGVYLSLDRNPNVNFVQLRDKLVQRLTCGIARAPLFGWDRAPVIQSLVVSLIVYQLPVGLLRESQVAELQRLILAPLREASGLPPGTPTAALLYPAMTGGLGLPALAALQVDGHKEALCLALNDRGRLGRLARCFLAPACVWVQLLVCCPRTDRRLLQVALAAPPRWDRRHRRLLPSRHS